MRGRRDTARRTVRATFPLPFSIAPRGSRTPTSPVSSTNQFAIISAVRYHEQRHAVVERMADPLIRSAHRPACAPAASRRCRSGWGRGCAASRAGAIAVNAVSTDAAPSHRGGQRQRRPGHRGRADHEGDHAAPTSASPASRSVTSVMMPSCMRSSFSPVDCDSIRNGRAIAMMVKNADDDDGTERRVEVHGIVSRSLGRPLPSRPTSDSRRDGCRADRGCATRSDRPSRRSMPAACKTPAAAG